MSQISFCRESFNEGDSDMISNSVSTLRMMITPRMVDKQYTQTIKELDEEFEREYKEKLASYEREIRSCKCPDVFPRPSSKPDSDYWKKVFVACHALFERKKLLLKPAGEESL